MVRVVEARHPPLVLLPTLALLLRRHLSPPFLTSQALSLPLLEVYLTMLPAALPTDRPLSPLPHSPQFPLHPLTLSIF